MAAVSHQPYSHILDTSAPLYQEPASLDLDTLLLDDTAEQPFSTDELQKECILFPTYAMQSPTDPSLWIIRVKAWALSHKTSGTKQRLMMGITKSVAKAASTDPKTTHMFEKRFSYFMAKNKRNKVFIIKATGPISLQDSRRDPYSLSSSLNDDEQFPGLYETEAIDYASYLNRPFSWTTPPFGRPKNPLSIVLNSSIVSRAMSGSLIDRYTTYDCPSYFDYLQNTPPLNTGSSQHPLDPLQESFVSENTGFFGGTFEISDEQVQNWAKQHGLCDPRLIQLRSDPSPQPNPTKSNFLPTTGLVSLIRPSGISIISDIDDTIKDTRVLNGARTVISNTFFKEPKDVDGMADAYMGWYTQGASFHYVSNSPFQLLPMLDRFIHQNQFPPGSIHLRADSSLFSRLVKVAGQAKRDAILLIMSDFPHRRFVLVGDSGEIDLEIYSQIALENPGRILKIFIRDVTTPFFDQPSSTSTSSVSAKQTWIQSTTRRSGSFLSLLLSSKRKMSEDSQDSDDQEHGYNHDAMVSAEINRIKNRENEENKESDEKNIHILNIQMPGIKLTEPVDERVTLTERYDGLSRSLDNRNSKNLLDVKEWHTKAWLEETEEKSKSETEEEEEERIRRRGIRRRWSDQDNLIIKSQESERLSERLAAARAAVPAVDIVLFSNAEELSQDNQVRDALWKHWDDQSMQQKEN
ncbi:hypothetical protein PHYBLDRAFT_64058 [Phycomyces blakesleeanus NRRL 1555(-)]|uniref:Phosphatidate phosphatase APP1 catalytic domain-containing protein n=1 Tax=Phycomyces blakesleeanus (strain ATCC 8743b / DSM 1359 / FGSC 10004 / NBRC 33097 / NRRL 1555) TaxID=763407 RepID=A0A167LPS8_PHYB8|nr:hypothetical protein PHYBLDRAFT_64058 [Phycomyces blakesleeanus NRRL 1555(-)]OAD70868.1 hypothetical protein PHYBLDRAFT_64058 [Phycomyces blakesleeanus NRRL 1555(-)]|eukprot:XP_018288908.1 hypothetical protein PHYBLDRAFT_64058 [Phycomyces blakesleeanus NRRL 1555(-)]